MSSSKTNQSIDSQIDENLRRIFEEDVEQDLPDRLQRLVDMLDAPDESGDDTEDEGGPDRPDVDEAQASRAAAAASRRAGDAEQRRARAATRGGSG